MKRYQVQWNYRASGLGPWQAGDIIELDEETAAYVLRDSPGALQSLDDKPQRQDRMVRRAQLRLPEETETPEV